MKLTIHEFDLPLKHTFTISRESTSIQKTMIVELADGELRGYGEATTNPYYQQTMQTMSACLLDTRDRIENASWNSPEELWEQVAPRFASSPFALCALDQAAHDLWGKQLGKPVYELWGQSVDNIPVSNFTIGIDTIDVMLQKLAETPGWPIYKIKLGTEHDLEIIRRLREQTAAVFRVDANCGWTADQAIEYSHTLKELGVEFIEQPIPAGQWEQQQRLFELSALPLVADESCILPTDVAACEGYFHGINIKLVKCGGLTPARRMIQDAQNRNLRLMVGCMTESTVGISAIAQLLPYLDYVDMDGAALLARDIASGVFVDHGKCQYPSVPGCGVTLQKPNRIA